MAVSAPYRRRGARLMDCAAVYHRRSCDRALIGRNTPSGSPFFISHGILRADHVLIPPRSAALDAARAALSSRRRARGATAMEPRPKLPAEAIEAYNLYIHG